MGIEEVAEKTYQTQLKLRRIETMTEDQILDALEECFISPVTNFDMIYGLSLTQKLKQMKSS